MLEKMKQQKFKRCRTLAFTSGTKTFSKFNGFMATRLIKDALFRWPPSKQPYRIPMLFQAIVLLVNFPTI